MPQASSELSAKFPGDDQEAFEVIDTNFVIAKGWIIRPKHEGYKMTEREGDAIDYLCDEWDYCYNPKTLGEEDGL
jgi:hypothetical protein